MLQERGGYKRIPYKELDRTWYEPARKRGLWDKRRRFWRRKPSKFIEYVKSFVFRTGKEGVYYTVDIVQVEEVPYDFSEDQASYGEVDPGRIEKMRRYIEDGPPSIKGKEFPVDLKYLNPLDTETGGWRWVLGGPTGLRWEDLRTVKR